jgi:hypothetical protein
VQQHHSTALEPTLPQERFVGPATL